MSSAIARIVDYTAVVAARVQDVRLPNGTVVGVRSIYGAGQGVYPDPLRPGQLVAAVPARPIDPFSHISDLPGAPTVTPLTQDGTVRFEWTVPMRLYVTRGDDATVRQTLMPFYDAYEGAFWPDRRLGGLCELACIKSFSRAADDDWAWLEMDLSVVEIVTY